jgi:hypothetical protein
MNDHIKEYLLGHYFKLENPQYAVMLKGKWGCGKTYFITELLKEISSKKDEDDDKIIIKPIYISLNGLRSTSEISEKISAEIYPFLHSKFMKISKSILGGFLKGVAKFEMDLDGNNKKDGTVSLKIDPQSFFSTKDPKIKGNRILIFDDIERSSIPTNEMFGYINHFIEHAECKVILIANEEILEKNESKEDNEKSEERLNDEFDYNKIKEKLIGQTFTIQPNTINTLNSINNENPLLSQVIDFKKEKELIIDFFNASEANNLRILKQCFLDFKRFVDLIDNTFKKKDNYDQFLSNLLSYFLIVSLECKMGRKEIEFFQNINELIINSTDTSVIKKKYSVQIEKHNFYYATEIVPIKTIYQFIENGNVDEKALNHQLKTASILRDDYTKTWGNLIRWRWMEDKELLKILNKTYNEFTKNELENIYSILFVSSWLLFFINEKILIKDRKQIVERAIKLLNSSIKNSKNVFDDILWIDFNGVWGNSFKDTEHKNFKIIKDHLLKLLSLKNEELIKEHLSKIFINKTQSLSLLLKNLDRSVPMQTTQFKRLEIFKVISGGKFNKAIINYSNSDLISLNSFIVKRYGLENFNPSNLEKHQINDLPALFKLKMYLSKNLPDVTEYPVKHRNLKQLIDNISFLEKESNHKQ